MSTHGLPAWGAWQSPLAGQLRVSWFRPSTMSLPVALANAKRFSRRGQSTLHSLAYQRARHQVLLRDQQHIQADSTCGVSLPAPACTSGVLLLARAPPGHGRVMRTLDVALRTRLRGGYP
mmetsp:Transcript_58339/g.133879  ORF Transcript_58339/g.133879 Transcript_58339/m.133879 type:complete len:120 (+) Transcript_58339:146-505(+)